MSRTDDRAHILILVQNLAVPFDRRVWQEARSLVQAGYAVSVICPKSAQHPLGYEILEGVQIHRYSSPFEAGGLAGYVAEYGIALLAQTRLAWRVHRRRSVDVVQACNPPDLLFLVALPLMVLGRAKFVFDHHDVSPELLVAKGHAPGSAVVRFARALEKCTFRLASVSIATNDSYRDVAVDRGGMSPDDVFVVRSGADLSRFSGAEPDASLRGGAEHLVAYVGVMGVQEGIDYLLDAVNVLVREMDRDVRVVLAGSGPDLPRLRARTTEMGLDEHVRFLGRVPDDVLTALLATADVCVNPDEYNAMNDMSTMNKIMDYMALGRPIVQFDLREGRLSAGDASLYASPNDARALAEGIAQLLDDPALRERMGAYGRQRLQETLTWERQVPALLAAYERVLRRRARRQAAADAA